MKETGKAGSFWKLKKTGFHADLIETVVLQLNGGVPPEAYVYLLSTTFDDSNVFRHLDYAGISDGIVTMIHVDELPVGVRWYSHLTSAKKIKGVELGSLEMGDASLDGSFEAGDDGGVLTLFLPVNITQNVEMQSLQCDDPTCEGDHGLQGSIKDEGLLLAFTGIDDESSSFEDVFEFVRRLMEAMTA